MDKLTIKNLDLYYSEFKALKNINLNIQEKEITAQKRKQRNSWTVFLRVKMQGLISFS